ncbi:MAG: DUF2059 domain-containing protein [Paracoccaceae bacterium]
MFLRPLVMTVSLVVAAPAVASEAADRLLDLVGMPRIVEVMRQEGLDYGSDLAADMLPGGVSAGWEATVARLYDPDTMEETVRQGFRAEIGQTDLSPLLDFFDSAEGRRVVALEVSARRAMMDDAVEQAARADYIQRAGAGDDRLALIAEFVEANDLVEANVVGALNSNFMFYRGLVEGGALELSEAEMLDDVWRQEDDTRDDTREWLYGFLLLAYGPLEDPELEDYVALSTTPEGRALNRALFVGFDRMYAEISYGLGLAVAQEMRSEEL